MSGKGNIKTKEKRFSWSKIGNLIKSNYKMITLVCVITIISTLLLVLKLRELDFSLHSKHGLLAFGVLGLMTIIIVAVLWFARAKKWKIERVFLICGLILGTFFCFILPCGAAPDESIHFWRVYELAEGRIFPDENGDIYVPDNIKDVIDNYYIGQNGYYWQNEKSLITPSDNYVPADGLADSYAVFNYIPQIVAVWVGKIFNMPYIPMMLLGRLLNMICCVIIVYFCIKYIPMMKKMVFLIAMFPMTMQQFASVSADGLIICAGIALITYVLYARKAMKRMLNWKDFLLLLIICLVLVVTKPVYALLCLIVFWLPKERFKSNRAKLMFILLLGGLTAAMMLVKMILSPVGGGRFNAADYQLEFIKNNPLTFLMMVFNNNMTSSIDYGVSVIGKNMEWFSVDIYDAYIILLSILFILLCAEKEMKISRSLRNFALIAFIGMDLLTFASMFMMYSTPNQFYIEGVQGRYFLPIILLIPIICMPVNKELKKNCNALVKPGYLYTITALVNVYAIVVIMCSHFG